MENINVAREFINSNDYLASVDLSGADSASQFMNRIENFYGLSGKNNFSTSFFAFHSGIV